LLLCPVNKAIPDNSPYPVPFVPNHASVPIYPGSGNAFPGWASWGALGVPQMAQLMFLGNPLGKAFAVTPKAWL